MNGHSLNAKKQDPLDNIISNAEILRKNSNIPKGQVDKAKQQALEHYNNVKK